MAEPRAEAIYYKRERFVTHLPKNRLYTRSHNWLLEEQAGIWRVGLTKFATRMLGDTVEFGFAVQANQSVAIGQTVGWVEGFKALSDLYCVVDGEFAGPNPALEADITLLDSDPYGQGWLYRVRGAPEPDAVDVNGYVTILDATIDKMLASRHDATEKERG